MSTIGIGDLTVNRLGFGAMRVCGPQAQPDVLSAVGAEIHCRFVPGCAVVE
jgi:hypothetical protein